MPSEPKDAAKTYTTIVDANTGTSGVNFYGVILDAQFPHKSFKSDKYVCSFKVADPGCFIDKKDSGHVNFCTLVMFANKFEDLPISQRVGDIIRIHRASVGMYKGIKQFTANIFFNSSWLCLPHLYPKAKPKTKNSHQLPSSENT